MDDTVFREVILKSEDGKDSQTYSLPLNVSSSILTELVKLKSGAEINESKYRFFISEREILSNLDEVLSEKELKDEEAKLEITYIEEAPFRVRPISRCTSSITGHAESVVSAMFNPTSQTLATGSGDTTIRLWDIQTKTPLKCLDGHKHWVLCLAWSPDGKTLASGDKNGLIGLWHGDTGQQIGTFLNRHKRWINMICWEPYHVNTQCSRIASCSKDCSIIIWNIRTRKPELILSSHTQSVTCIRWGGMGLLYSASQDRTVKVWRVEDGVLCRTLEGHAHWVNTLATNCDWLLRVGPHDPILNIGGPTPEKIPDLAKARYLKIRGDGEILVSGSEDNTMYLWNPESNNKPVARLTGHQQLINDVKFSPDGRTLASASFDKTIRLWDGLSGRFLAVLRGHVQAVYVLSWAPDSRLLVSGSADSTLKVWDIRQKKFMVDLPGHGDQVFAVDWSPNGATVGSGGKDKLVKIWES